MNKIIKSHQPNLEFSDHHFGHIKYQIRWLKNLKLRRSLQLCCFIFLIVFGGTQLQAEDELEFDCLIEPHSVVDVSTFSDGVMAEVLVGRGDIIKKQLKQCKKVVGK